jgi:DNA-binding transcriptional LysR family regulator
MDIKRWDFNLLVTLDALLAERSVSRAARRLNLSQPALSAQLARLREMLGDPLFVPSHRGMTPTPLALGLRAPLAAALAQLRDVHVMVSPRGGSFATPVDDVLDAQGLRRRVVVSASTFRSVPELVERSDLVTLVPARMVEGRAGRLRVLAPPFPVPGFAIHMAWHNRNHGDAAQRWVRERLVAFAQYSAQAARAGR